MANFVRIRKLSEEKKITIRELAKRIGVKDAAIQKIITKGSTNTSTIEKIASVFGVPVGYFFDELPESSKKAPPSDKELIETQRELIKELKMRLAQYENNSFQKAS
jgi:transcriptional regulator with XRE-family HTH domain